jgi:hypothetical protein
MNSDYKITSRVVILCVVFILSVTGCASQDVLTGFSHNYEIVRYNDGLDAYKREDYATALEKWTPLAEKGIAYAQINMALLYSTGRGVPMDYTKALVWNRRAASQGYPVAQNNLGVMYQNGQGVPVDHAEAIRWYTLAAEQGDPKAKENLAKLMDKTSSSNNSPGSKIDITGVYSAWVTRRSSQDYYCFNGKRKFLIELNQANNGFEGEFLSGITGKFQGTLEKDRIKFTYYTARCVGGSEGEWILSPDGSGLEGYGWDEIKWKLLKTN